MSDVTNEAINFLNTNQDDPSGVGFDIVENYKQDDKDGTKLTAQFRFGTRYDNNTFFATYWKPGAGIEIAEGSVCALVFISHGYCEYVGDSYDEVAKRMSIQLGGGCLVFGHDHIGHGRTTAGNRALANEMDEFVDPIIAHIEAVQNWANCGSGKLPVFLVGHSMGGLISLFTLFKKEALFKVCKLYIILDFRPISRYIRVPDPGTSHCLFHCNFIYRDSSG